MFFNKKHTNIDFDSVNEGLLRQNENLIKRFSESVGQAYQGENENVCDLGIELIDYSMIGKKIGA
jgi:hypothetical protein